jgi:hypothetical protein
MERKEPIERFVLTPEMVEERKRIKEAKDWLKQERARKSNQKHKRQSGNATEFELEDFFMEAAERILQPTVFSNILSHAKKDLKAHQQRLTEQRISRFKAIRDD